MFDKYKDKKKRKEYMRQYRISNREKIYSQRLVWMEKNEKTYSYGDKYKNKYSRPNKEQGGKKLLGSCGIGRDYELKALELLKGSTDCNNKNFKGPWDIEWNGLKIDVKMRNKNIKTNKWSFDVKNCKAEYFLLFCVDNKEIIKTLLIKNNGKTQIQLGLKSIYDKFMINII